MRFNPGDQVEVFSGHRVVDSETGEPFWFPAIVTAGPFPTSAARDGYYTLGVGPAEYPFDQHCHLAQDMRVATVHRDDLNDRYRAFRAWSAPARQRVSAEDQQYADRMFGYR